MDDGRQKGVDAINRGLLINGGGRKEGLGNERWLAKEDDLDIGLQGGDVGQKRSNAVVREAEGYHHSHHNLTTAHKVGQGAMPLSVECTATKGGVQRLCTGVSGSFANRVIEQGSKGGGSDIARHGVAGCSGGGAHMGVAEVGELGQGDGLNSQSDGRALMGGDDHWGGAWGDGGGFGGGDLGDGLWTDERSVRGAWVAE